MAPMGQRPPMHGMGPRPRQPMGGQGIRGRGGMMHGRPRASMMAPPIQNQVKSFINIYSANHHNTDVMRMFPLDTRV